MHKLFFLTAILALSLPVHAETCMDGTLIKDNNGNEFCQSNSGMEWWRAFTWCESRGRKLASFQRMCSSEQLSSQDDLHICPNLKDIENGAAVWSSFGYGGNLALYIDLHSGTILRANYNDTTIRALCE